VTTPVARASSGLATVVPVVVAGDSVAAGATDAVVDPLTGSLVVMYAWDAGDPTLVVTSQDLESLGVDRPSLAAAALDNLVDRMSDLQILERPDGCGMLRIDGTLEASALLVTSLWRDIAAVLSDDVLVAVAARDTVLFCAAGIAPHRRALVAARDRALAVGNHRLTDELFRFDANSTWQREP
jgi:uncharacterized protein YtpQ (UPF0354 family)